MKAVMQLRNKKPFNKNYVLKISPKAFLGQVTVLKKYIAFKSFSPDFDTPVKKPLLSSNIRTREG